MADSVGAVCAVLNLPAGATTSTIESKTNFFRGVRDGRGPLDVDAAARRAHDDRRPDRPARRPGQARRPGHPDPGGAGARRLTAARPGTRCPPGGRRTRHDGGVTRSFADTLTAMEALVARCAADGDRRGYFAAMYLAVTRTVRDRVEHGTFADDGGDARLRGRVRRPLPRRRRGLARRPARVGGVAGGVRGGHPTATGHPPAPPARDERPHQPRPRRDDVGAGRRRVARRRAPRLRRRQRRARRAHRRLRGGARPGLAVDRSGRPRRGRG